MSYRVGIYYGALALYRDLTRITFSDSKTECFSHHVSRNSIRNNGARLAGTMNYDTFPRITLLDTVLRHSILCNDEFHVSHGINFAHKY